MDVANKHAEKKEFTGDHGGKYSDMDGNVKQFTYVDHDPKPTASAYIAEDKEKIIQKLKDYRDRLVDRIIEVDPEHSADVHQDYVRRGTQGIEWDELMLRDGGMTLDRLRDVYILAENKKQFFDKGLTY